MKQRFRDAVNILCYKVENSNMSIQNVSPFPDILYILYLDYLIKECDNLREGYRTLGVVTNSKGFMHIFSFILLETQLAMGLKPSLSES